MKTCLLDLNFTLVANSSHGAGKVPMAARIEAETYRQDLIDALRGMSCRVVLVTARPASWSKATLHSIESKTGWHPDECWFNDLGMAPPAFKRLIVEQRILPTTPANDLFGVESNPATRGVYRSLGIQSWAYADFMALIASGELPAAA